MTAGEVRMAATPMTDEQLMDDVARGDETAFRQLMTRHKTGVLNFLYRMINDRHAAEDLAQDVFVKVYTRADAFDRERRFTAWLYQVARNRAVDYLRSRETRDRALDEARRRQPETVEPRPQSRMIAGEDVLALRAAIHELPEYYRDVLVFCDLQGMSYEDTGRVLEIPVRTVSSRLFRARNTLREKLAKA